MKIEKQQVHNSDINQDLTFSRYIYRKIMYISKKYVTINIRINIVKQDDEGQDLIRLTYCECFDLILKGGLENGDWCIFLDANQNLYNQVGLEEGLEYI